MMHRHIYVESERFYAAPIFDTKIEGYTGMVERLTFGVTTILFKCQTCGLTRTEEILGRGAHFGSGLDNATSAKVE